LANSFNQGLNFLKNLPLKGLLGPNSIGGLPLVLILLGGVLTFL